MNEDTAPVDLVGTVLAGRYRILKRLGEGAMGAVYLGEHLKIGRKDAIKVLRDTLATDREATQRFLRGARTVSSIRHPNVCTIYDFSDTADGLQFLAMEFVAGETLKELLERERRLPVERAVAIAIQVADALDAAHDVGVVHRDLKPGNIMLVPGRDGRDVVKVVDFDIAKGPDTGGEEVTRLGFVVGTPEYMSPEQLMGEPLDGRSDVYSLALVLFRMLTGTLPFQAETTQDVMIQRLTHAPLRLSEAMPGVAFPQLLQDVLDRALDRRPAARPDAAEFARAIAAALGNVAAPTKAVPHHGTPSPTGGELPPTRVGPAAQQGSTASGTRPDRRRTLAIAAAVVVAVVAGAGAVLLLGGDDQTGEISAETTGSTDARPPDLATALPAESVSVTTPETTTVADVSQQQVPASGRGERQVDPPPTQPPAQPPERPMVIDLALINGTLFRQLDRLDENAMVAPDGATLAAVIDTARTVWEMRTSAADSDRALAAFVLGNAYNVRRDWYRCVQWLDSAIALGHHASAMLRASCERQIR